MGGGSKIFEPNEDPQGFSCTAGHVVDMGVPGEVTCQGYTKEFSLIYDFQGRGTREMKLREEVVLLCWVEGDDLRFLMVNLHIVSCSKISQVS